MNSVIQKILTLRNSNNIRAISQRQTRQILPQFVVVFRTNVKRFFDKHNFSFIFIKSINAKFIELKSPPLSRIFSKLYFVKSSKYLSILSYRPRSNQTHIISFPKFFILERSKGFFEILCKFKILFFQLIYRLTLK